MAKYPKKVFRGNQIAVSLNQTEVATLLNALRHGWIMEGKTNSDITAKLHDALISAGRDPDKFGFHGETCTIGLCLDCVSRLPHHEQATCFGQVPGRHSFRR